MPTTNRVTALGSGLVLGATLLLQSCGRGDSITSDPAGRIESSRATAAWSPPAGATCTRKEHNRFTVVGPDGRRYPTWHPAVDPVTGCSFGHDHGRDPHGSRLYRLTGAIPFGLANEALAAIEPARRIAEDHAGHRILWANGVRLQQSVEGRPADIGVRCDVLMKVYVGEAGRMEPHELAYHVRCDDGTELHATRLVQSGDRGMEAALTTGEGGQLAFFDPGFGVGEPEHGGVCPDCITFRQTGIYNAGGPTVWYTDPMGANARTTAFPGSIRQFVGSVNNDRGFALVPQVLGAR